MQSASSGGAVYHRTLGFRVAPSPNADASAVVQDRDRHGPDVSRGCGTSRARATSGCGTGGTGQGAFDTVETTRLFDRAENDRCGCTGGRSALPPHHLFVWGRSNAPASE